MVLSLGFILAFIGAAVALLIGILIFSEVSDSIICPAPTSGGGSPIGATGFDNVGSMGTAGDAFYTEAGIDTAFVTTTGILGQGIIKNGTSSGDTDGEVIIGINPDSWRFLHAGNVGSNLTSINFWLNGDVIGSPVYPLLGTGGTDNAAANSPTFSMWTQSGTNGMITIYEASGGGGQVFQGNIGSVVPDDSGWHMVSLMMNQGNRTGDFIILCIDAVCDTGVDAMITDFEDLTAGGNTPAFNLTVGGGSPFGNSVTQNTFDFDELTIWNGWILTQGQLNTMWNAGSGSSASGIASGTIVVHLSFDSGTEIGGTPGSPGSSGQGNLECEGAKDTAWTVIGILPVALFFALFAIFGALGRTE